MLIMGHRGSSLIHHANTLEALYAGVQANADMLVFEVYLTKDNIPVLLHGSYAINDKFNHAAISRLTFSELYSRTEERPVVPLSQVLDEFLGTILLNIELKGHGTGKVVADLLIKKYIKSRREWDNIIMSSFLSRELSAARKRTKDANFALLHSQNPFLFIAHHRRLKLSAVGFHRLHLNDFAIEIARRSGLFTYVYTVNRPETALKLARKGIDGIITDRPEVIIKEISKQS